MSEETRYFRNLLDEMNRRSWRAYLSVLGVRNVPLRQHLSQFESSSPGSPGCLLASPVFEARFGHQPGAFSANAYDALYLLGYAIAATGTDSITGASIAQGLTRLSEGEEVRVGAGDWNTGIQKLASAPLATIDFEGASGSLDFDEHGEATSSIEAWVLNLDDKETETLGVIFDPVQGYTTPQFGTRGGGTVCTNRGPSD